MEVPLLIKRKNSGHSTFKKTLHWSSGPSVLPGIPSKLSMSSEASNRHLRELLFNWASNVRREQMDHVVSPELPRDELII